MKTKSLAVTLMLFSSLTLWGAELSPELAKKAKLKPIPSSEFAQFNEKFKTLKKKMPDSKARVVHLFDLRMVPVAH
ncbi:hypothetical protein CCZ01_08695 [Helicobacter monodelphidis]|uniref:hypothetical protein n=1 Tax=Helicobacter sp. 15-1451 TaxID=2004995 RepID=UPI000DCC2BDA|nr:hypothetical protein [Helicobacter sp. 15-1451]RAX56714.1 hypothetical protein CCZ01_08695 [Helicobacter sp. 15-1451]